jgi:hypothetical protein
VETGEVKDARAIDMPLLLQLLMPRMRVGRREMMRLLAGMALAASPVIALWRGRARAGTALGVRAVTAGDAPALQAIMTACVGSDDSFFGKCGVWTLDWAAALIARCPQSIVLTRDETPVAFFELKPIKPALADAAADPEQQAWAARARTVCRITSAGVLPASPDEAVPLFYTLLYQAFLAARAMGYAYVEAFAPWERHPLLDRAWTEYPGCELVDPPAHNQAGGRDLYHIRWDLAEAVTALAGEVTLHVG